VRLRWQDAGRARECLVPVMDEFGRLAAADLVSLGFDEAWWALMGFPLRPTTTARPGMTTRVTTAAMTATTRVTGAAAARAGWRPIRCAR
jgi:hypothetical protein